MIDKNIRSLPIISDKTNKIVGVISASDIRVLGLPMNESIKDLLSIDASSFSKKTRKTLKEHYTNTFSDQIVVTCTLKSTLREVFDSLFTYHIHQLYVLNDSGLPIGKVSLVDIIRCFI